ncbi:MAG: SAF domain-containing protein [Acidimicrobiia bacterium]
MGETALGSRPDAARREGPVGGARALRRRRALPGGRAVVGGFLVAAAAVGVFAGYTDATAGPRERYLVARHDLPLGHRLAAADVEAVALDLPPTLAARSYRSASQLTGAVVLGPVGKGELVQSSDVLTGAASSGERQISFPVESARAVNGQLRRGEVVDVVATYGTGGDAYTVVVVAGARVADRSASRDSLSTRGDEVITLALPASADALAVAHAVNAGAVTLVRTAGASADGASPPAAYSAPRGARPPGPAAGPG